MKFTNLLLLCLCLMVSVEGFKPGGGGFAIGHQTVKFAQKYSKTVEKLNNPPNSVTYNNPTLDKATSVPAVGKVIEGVATVVRLTEGAMYMGAEKLKNDNNS